MSLTTIILLCTALFQSPVYAGNGKTIYLPEKIATVPEHNDFNDNRSEYSNKRSAESPNFIVYWAKEYGADPLLNKNLSKRFDTNRLLEQSERFFSYYTDVLKIVIKGKSVSDKHKVLILITGGDEGTAYGWGAENKVGIFWTPATRINKEPYGMVAHELGHVFQFFANCDHNNVGFNGPINEMAAQYLLWQVYPEWVTFEKFHMEGFVKKSYLAFLHPENAYHSPFLIEYWSEKHGKQFYGKMLREVRKEEDPVETYQRLTKITQEQFNNEVYDASCKFVTWDLKRVRKIADRYANQHSTVLDLTKDGWLRVSKQNCPESYGYNAIKLKVPIQGNVVAVQFRSGINAEGVNYADRAKVGWRYGFVAYRKDGKRFYGTMHDQHSSSASFTVPENTSYLWLVVIGAPESHLKFKSMIEELDQYPYEIKVLNSDLSL
jgi:hypothetical protein